MRKESGTFLKQEKAASVIAVQRVRRSIERAMHCLPASHLVILDFSLKGMGTKNSIFAYLYFVCLFALGMNYNQSCTVRILVWLLLREWTRK